MTIERFFVIVERQASGGLERCRQRWWSLRSPLIIQLEPLQLTFCLSAFAVAAFSALAVILVIARSISVRK
jgi:hypothetical protein